MPSYTLEEIIPGTTRENAVPPVVVRYQEGACGNCTCRKKKCCNKYKRKGKHCKSCPKR